MKKSAALYGRPVISLSARKLPRVAGDLRARGEEEPKNLVWQRAFSTTYERVGDVLMAKGNVREALTSYETSFDMADKSLAPLLTTTTCNAT